MGELEALMCAPRHPYSQQRPRGSQRRIQAEWHNSRASRPWHICRVCQESKNADPMPTQPDVTARTRRDAQLLEASSTSRVDHTLKASLSLRVAPELDMTELEDAWLVHADFPNHGVP